MMAMMIMLSSRAGRVFTVPGDKILPYFKGFRQDEYPTTFPLPLLLLLQFIWRNIKSYFARKETETKKKDIESNRNRKKENRFKS